MTNSTLERLAAGIKAADAAGDAEAVRRLGAEYRRLQATSSGVEAPVSTGISAALGEGVDSFGKRLSLGVEGAGQLLDWRGLENLGSAGVAKAEASQAERNYKRDENYDGVFKNIFEGEFGNAAGSLGYGALESAPSMGAGLVASAGALVSAPVTATVATGVTMMDAFGGSREEKSDKGIEGDATYTDLASGIASGLLELVPMGKGGGFVVRALKEGVQEVAQEGTQIAGTAYQGGEYVPEEVALRLMDAGAIGTTVSGGLSGAYNAAGKVAQNVSIPDLRHDKGFDEYDAGAVEWIERATDGDTNNILGNVSTTDSDVSAQGAVKNALINVRARMRNRAADLQKLAKSRKDVVASDAVRSLMDSTGNLKSSVTENDVREVLQSFPDVREAQEFATFARQARKIQPLSESMRDLGGLSRYTYQFDFLDGRNHGINKGISFIAGLGPTGFAVNRTARLVDKVLNRRSTIKRYVDSVKKEGVQSSKIAKGRTVQEILDGIKADAQKERDLAKQAALAPKQEALAAKLADKQQKADQKAALGDTNKKLHREATREGWETGKLPDSSTYDPYRRWEERTGMSMQDTYDALKDAEMAPEGLVPQGTADRYRDDPRSFTKSPEDMQTAFMLQEILRSNYNPDFKYSASSVGPDPTQVLRKLEAVSSKPVGNRGKYKAREGERRRTNLTSTLESSKESLSANQYGALQMLAEEMDSPAVTRAERFKMMDRELETIFENPADREKWRKEFTDVAAIGNDIAILREASGVDENPEAEIEQAFEEKKVSVRKEASKKSKGKSTVEKIQKEPDSLPETKADKALKKLEEGSSEATQDTQSPADVDNTAQEIKVKSKATGSTSLKNMVLNRTESLAMADQLALDMRESLAEYRDNLGKSTRDRVENMIYEVASDRVTQNMLTDAYAAAYDVPPEVAAEAVNIALASMEASGQIKRFVPSGASGLKVDGKYKKSADGKALKLVQIELTDPEMAERVEVAKAVRTIDRMVNQNGPSKLYTPQDIKDGSHRALKDVPSSGVNETFKPLLDFQNDLRTTPLMIQPDMLNQIDASIASNGAGNKKVGVIGEVLRPVTGESVTRGRDGKLRKKTDRDDSPLRTVSQLFYLFAQEDGMSDTTFYQEWTAGANGRVYSKNGQAHTQAGDIMKGLTRFAQRSKLGGTDGFNMLLHSFGNLLGMDKEAPAVRRGAIYKEGTIKTLLSFAKDPFRKGVLNQEVAGRPLTAIGKLVNSGEGFFQVLNVAHEVKSMVEWSRERHKDKSKLTDEQLLMNPDVTADLADNYETDFIVQLDASNNAYQLLGMTTGNADMLKSTGMASAGNNFDPDTTKGGDIYLDPAKAVASRIPELNNLNLPTKTLRKLFKGPIGTFLYEAEFASRKESFEASLNEIAEGAPIVSVVEGAGLITVPAAIVDNVRSESGHTFQSVHYNVGGNEKGVTSVRKRVVKDGDGFVLETASGGGKFGASRRNFTTEAEAIEAMYLGDLFSRMNRELVRDINMRFPHVQEYLRFSGAVTRMLKARGQDHVVVPSPDGMMLESSFKDDYEYAAKDVELTDGKVVPMGYRTEESKLTGRGLAAFMMHQLDAYVLRETHRRLKAEGRLQTGFNPIHDSFGFPAADAKRGQEVWVEVMQELGSPDYNIFLQVLEANQISLPEFTSPENKGVIPSREGVKPVQAAQIPTALS